MLGRPSKEDGEDAKAIPSRRGQGAPGFAHAGGKERGRHPARVSARRERPGRQHPARAAAVSESPGSAARRLGGARARFFASPAPAASPPPTARARTSTGQIEDEVRIPGSKAESYGGASRSAAPPCAGVRTRRLAALGQREISGRAAQRMGGGSRETRRRSTPSATGRQGQGCRGPAPGGRARDPGRGPSVNAREQTLDAIGATPRKTGSAEGRAS